MRFMRYPEAGCENVVGRRKLAVDVTSKIWLCHKQGVLSIFVYQWEV